MSLDNGPQLAALLAPKPRGFAAIDKQRQSEIASEGGRAAHRSGAAHRFSAEEASKAGKLSAAARQKVKSALLLAATGREGPHELAAGNDKINAD